MREMKMPSGRGRLFAIGLSLAVVASLTGASMFSMALFTDSETDDSTFTAGTIALDATKIAAMDLTSSSMMPGDVTRGPVTVENTGSAQLRYAVSQSSTNPDSLDLRSTLTLVIRNVDTDVADGDSCDDATGTVVRASATIGASGNLVGDPTQGSQAGDRTLNAGASETLCFYVTLPSGASNSVQGATTTTTFTFAAEQTANN